MKTLVYGAGGVGTFFGGLLARAGQDVCFVARGAQLEALRARGIRIESTLLGTFDVPSVKVVERAAESGPADLVLVCVKSHQTASILDDMSAVASAATSVVTLQNGVESDEVIAGRLGRTRVFPAVVYVGATVAQPGVVSHIAAGTIAVGASAGSDASRLPAIVDTLAATGQPVRVSDDIQHERWRKLIWNAGFNTISAIARMEPAEMLARPGTRALMTAVMREVVDVARARGIGLAYSDVDDQIAFTERIGTIRTSMMVDRERGREMEVDAIIGVVVRQGRALGVATPYSEAVFALLDAIGSSDGRRVGG
jgi:2-dehydropantoate 2-reductase